MTMPNIDSLKRACEICTSTTSFKCTELTLLINACAEAAQYRRELHLPHAEKYDAMQEKLHKLSEKLDESIEVKARQLDNAAKHRKTAQL